MAQPLHWYGVPARVLLLTFLGTLLTFTVSLLLAIAGSVILSVIHGIHPDLRVAYRHIALPCGVVAAGILLFVVTTIEVRHYHQRKTLRKLERMG